MLKKKFDFFCIAKVRSDREELLDIDGKEGVVIGHSEDDNGNNYYGISVEGITWMVNEEELLTTGKVIKKEDFYPN